MKLHIDPRRVARVLFAAAGLLIAAHFAMMFSRFVLDHARLFGIAARFNVNVETSVPTFFSVTLLVACAVTLAVVARMPANSTSDRRHWNGLAAILLFIAVDEHASLHELWVFPLRRHLPDVGVLYFGWVVPYALLVLAVGILYLRFVFRLPEPTRRLVVASGCLYLAGAMGLEMFGGWYVSQVSGREDFLYMTIVAGEELLEMCGTILFLYALLDRLRRGLGAEQIVIRLGPS